MPRARRPRCGCTRSHLRQDHPELSGSFLGRRRPYRSSGR
jgi:hypothetical protein